MLTVQVYKILVHNRPFKPENIRWAHILGWCVEILHAFILIQDDIMDNSTTRRGQTCWYKLQEVGFKGINDSVLMENIIFMLLKKYFRNFDCYLDLVELFHDAIYLTACGQCLDVLTATHNISTFDTKKLNAISINKSAYYTFYLPYALAMHLAG